MGLPSVACADRQVCGWCDRRAARGSLRCMLQLENFIFVVHYDGEIEAFKTLLATSSVHPNKISCRYVRPSFHRTQPWRSWIYRVSRSIFWQGAPAKVNSWKSEKMGCISSSMVMNSSWGISHRWPCLSSATTRLAHVRKSIFRREHFQVYDSLSLGRIFCASERTEASVYHRLISRRWALPDSRTFGTQSWGDSHRSCNVHGFWKCIRIGRLLAWRTDGISYITWLVRALQALPIETDSSHSLPTWASDGVLAENIVVV